MCQEVCQEHFRQREEQVQSCRNVKLHDIFTEAELCRKMVSYIMGVVKDKARMAN